MIGTRQLATFGLGLGIILGASGCAKFPAVRLSPSLRAGAAPRVDAADPLPEMRRAMTVTVDNARRILNTDSTMRILNRHRAGRDRARWIVTGGTAATTLLGVVGSADASSSKGLAIATGVVGAVTTFFTAVRDDNDIANRIDACGRISQEGARAINEYQARWDARLVVAPSPEQLPARLQELENDGVRLMQQVTELMTGCF